MIRIIFEQFSKKKQLKKSSENYGAVMTKSTRSKKIGAEYIARDLLRRAAKDYIDRLVDETTDGGKIAVTSEQAITGTIMLEHQITEVQLEMAKTKSILVAKIDNLTAALKNMEKLNAVKARVYRSMVPEDKMSHFLILLRL